MLNIFFFANAADIALRWASFGFWRYWDLERYPNPPYTNAAINKYNSRTNYEIGNEGENRVNCALYKNEKYDLGIDDVSNIKNNGDMIVNIPSLDMKIMVEVKNHKTCISKQNVDRRTM